MLSRRTIVDEILSLADFAVPRISALLDRTGEFHQRAQKRYDDTAIILGEILEHGYDSERGRAALRCMNRIHARFAITNDDLSVRAVVIHLGAHSLARSVRVAATDAPRAPGSLLLLA
jgi:hypothetical protein